MVTRASDPLKFKALPYLPELVHVAPLTAPLFPLPDASFTTVPLPSLNPYAATKPVAGVAVGVGVVVGVGLGVPDGHDSLPILLNVPGEFLLLYSAVIQAAERFVLEIRTSSMSPLNVEDQKELAAITALGLAEVVDDAAVGHPSSDPSFYNLKFDPSNVPTM